MVQPVIFANPRSLTVGTKLLATATTQYTFGTQSETTGMFAPATSAVTTANKLVILNETVAAGVQTSVSFFEIQKGDKFTATTTNTADATHNGQKMVLSSASAVDNTGTTSASGVVRQVAVVGTNTAIFELVA